MRAAKKEDHGGGGGGGGGGTHLLLHRASATVGLELSRLPHHGSHHPLLLQVLIARVLAQLHDVVLALAPRLIEVDACVARRGS